MLTFSFLELFFALTISCDDVYFLVYMVFKVSNINLNICKSFFMLFFEIIFRYTIYSTSHTISCFFFFFPSVIEQYQFFFSFCEFG